MAWLSDVSFYNTLFLVTSKSYIHVFCKIFMQKLQLQVNSKFVAAFDVHFLGIFAFHVIAVHYILGTFSFTGTGIAKVQRNNIPENRTKASTTI